jgi:hypothetical protein
MHITISNLFWDISWGMDSSDKYFKTSRFIGGRILLINA